MLAAQTARQEDSPEDTPSRPLPELSKTKVKKLKALVQRKLEEKKRAKALTPPQPAPRYDEVFAKGVEWLDSEAGEPLRVESGRVRFADSIWKSPARREPRLP